MLIAAVFALSAGLVSGCGGDPTPNFADSSDPSTPSPTATASAKPETAEQFLRRWWAVNDRAQTTGDVREFEALSAPRCTSCNSYARDMKRIHDAGGAIKYGGTKIVWIHKTAAKNEYQVRTISPPTRYRESRNGPWKSFGGGSLTHDFELAHSDGQWLVVEYSQIAGSFAPLPGGRR